MAYNREVIPFLFIESYIFEKAAIEHLHLSLRLCLKLPLFKQLNILNSLSCSPLVSKLSMI